MLFIMLHLSIVVSLHAAVQFPKRGQEKRVPAKLQTIPEHSVTKLAVFYCSRIRAVPEEAGYEVYKQLQEKKPELFEELAQEGERWVAKWDEKTNATVTRLDSLMRCVHQAHTKHIRGTTLFTNEKIARYYEWLQNQKDFACRPSLDTIGCINEKAREGRRPVFICID
jgi:hypothetical protein